MKEYEVKIKKHIVPSKLKEYFPNNEVVYTIDCYSPVSRVWDDSIISNSFAFKTNWNDYVTIMQDNFNCVSKNTKLYYTSYSECERAIEFSRSLIIMNRLLK